jgi:hypothetical protein
MDADKVLRQYAIGERDFRQVDSIRISHSFLDRGY